MFLAEPKWLRFCFKAQFLNYFYSLAHLQCQKIYGIEELGKSTVELGQVHDCGVVLTRFDSSAIYDLYNLK